MSVIDEVVEILDLLYKHGWDERNGGNLSYIVTKEEVSEITDPDIVTRTFNYNCDMTDLIGKYFVITASGSYFKNMVKASEENLGILKVLDKKTLGLVWGYTNGAHPTSEAPTHLRCHIERLKVDKESRLVIHCHTTNIICMTHICPLDSKFFTETLWKMQTESIVVFPEGVAVLPWILCGGDLIGIETAKLMSEYRSVVWAQHGLFATGKSLDEVFGLIETIEKAAEIYMKICDKKIMQSISNDNLKEIAIAFNINYRKGIID
ncbi:MAG: rhamnulose-1-phosphate aldolase [Bacilli bacterium]|nr:rhamnulose-1-phosphate aldolase [Bacilli bacterium]